MSDRSGPPSGPPSGKPQPGTPEYDWLYGGQGGSGNPSTNPGNPDNEATQRIDTRGQAGQPGDDVERTQILPTGIPPQQAQPQAQAQAQAQQPYRQPPPPPQRPQQQPPMAPPPQYPPAQMPQPPRKRRRFRPVRWIIALLLLWIAYLIAVPMFAMQQVSKVDAFPKDEVRPDDQDGTTYLVVGSDKADDLTDEQRKALKTGPRGSTNTDTIMLLHTGSGPNVLMSIPRDTLVEIPGYGTGMVNSAFARGGPKLLVRTVEKLTGIRIDNYVEMGFGSIINTVDALGGIEICPKRDMKDPQARLDVKKGCQEADGETALAYSRSRHVFARSDLDRVGQQREVVSALGDKVMSPWTFVNPFRYWNFTMSAAKAIRVDEKTGPIDLGRFAMAMTGDQKTCTMPILPSTSDPGRLALDSGRAKQLFGKIIDDDTESINNKICTPTGLPRSMTQGG